MFSEKSVIYDDVLELLIYRIQLEEKQFSANLEERVYSFSVVRLFNIIIIRI